MHSRRVQNDASRTPVLPPVRAVSPHPGRDHGHLHAVDRALAKAPGGLDKVMLWMVTVPYAVNAVDWTVFYKFYPEDVKKRKQRMDLL